MSIFPDLLKVAKITPRPKKDNKFNHENSLLSVLSKIFEKVIRECMISWSKTSLYVIDNMVSYQII